jgi:hypothetical protein
MRNLLAASLVLLGYATAPAEAYGNIKGREPGVSMQLTEGFFREWKYMLMKDYVTYINVNKDKTLPKEIEGWTWKVKNIKYDDMMINVDNFKLDFDKKHKEVSIDFPLIKKLKAKGYLTAKFLGFIGVHSSITILIKDMELKAKIGAKVSRKGYPNYYAPKFSFALGHSSISLSKHPMEADIFNEYLRIFNVLASQATKWFGMDTVDLAITHTMNQLTNYYNFPMPYYAADGTMVPFGLDLRMTRNPLVGRDYMNLYFLGDMNYNFVRNQHQLPKKQIPHAFNHSKNSMQMIFSNHSVETFFTALDQAGLMSLTSNDPLFKEIMGMN